MRTTCLLLLTSLTFSLLAATPNNSQDTKAMNSQNRQRVTSTVNVQHSDAKVYDDDASPTLKELTLQETFSGDIEGESTVRVLQAAGKDGTMSFVALQRVRGSVGGRKGSFLLQPHGTVVGKETHAEWSVVPGSGTGELKGLRGDGGFQAQLGEQGSFWLDYNFE